MGEVASKSLLRPKVQASYTTKEIIGCAFPEVELMALVDELGDQAQKVHDGDLKRLESTLLSAQAHTLDTLFNHLALRAMKAEYVSQLETYLKLGLKAQSQCRATLETLAAIKNPQPVAFVKQANISQYQQVNNGVPEAAASRAEKIENAPNELLEHKSNQTLLVTVSPINEAIHAG